MLNTIRWSVWGKQIWVMLCGIAALITMIALLGRFDNRPVFSQMGLTLNAIISILSVTVKSAVAFILSECIAQWKWILYAREERLMIDFERFDGAARGPLGSLRVLIRTKGASVVRFGAILTVVAIALDPFAQQLLQLRAEVIHDTSRSSRALLSKATSYSLGTVNIFRTGDSDLTEPSTWTLNITTSLPLSMQGAITNGLYKSPEELRRETLFQCSTGNCTFQPFMTLGICHRCTDVTSNLTRMPGNYHELMQAMMSIHSSQRTSKYHHTGYSLPNGHFIANTDGCNDYVFGSSCKIPFSVVTSFGTGNPNRTVTMQDIDTLLWSMSIIYPDVSATTASGDPFFGYESPEALWPNVHLKALECALYYCVKRIISEVKIGRLEENITDVTGIKRSEYSWDLLRNDTFINPIPIPDTKLPPQYQAPPDEVRSLEFHGLWSVATYNPLTIAIPNHKKHVTIQSASIKSLGAYVQNLFRSERWFNITNDINVQKALIHLEGMKTAVGFNGAAVYPMLRDQPGVLNQLVSTNRSNFAGISTVFESMALSMTNEIRRTREQADIARNGMETMTYEGLAGSTIVLYVVKWQWIALHVTVLMLACALMLITIIESRSSVDVPLWKSSSLAALRHGNNIGGLLNDSGKSVANMEDAARKIYMSGRRIDVEETEHQGEQYAGLVESRRASQIDLNEGLAERSTTDTSEERVEPPNPASFHEPGSEMAPRRHSATF